MTEIIKTDRAEGLTGGRKELSRCSFQDAADRLASRRTDELADGAAGFRELPHRAQQGRI